MAISSIVFIIYSFMNPYMTEIEKIIKFPIPIIALCVSCILMVIFDKLYKKELKEDFKELQKSLYYELSNKEEK